MPGKPVIESIPFNKLTDKDKRESLEVVNLIAQNRCGRIKGRICTNRSRQCKYTNEGKSFTSPTVSLETIITILMIDAYENRDIAVTDVPSAYLHTKFPPEKRVILKLRGVLLTSSCVK